MDSEAYRVKAAACLLAAENTKLPNARERWLAMAQALNRLADEADRMGTYDQRQIAPAGWNL
jgi:hypothetical protein